MKVSDQQLTQFLHKHNEWRIDNGRLFRQCRFPNFAAAFGFMAQVAIIAEKQNHHPDWTNSYRTVEIWLSTHEFGGVSERDFALADAIDEILI